MCAKCDQLIHAAIDNNREAFTALIRKIHDDMGNRLVQLSPHADTTVADIAEAATYIDALVANYLVAFLTMENGIPDELTPMLVAVHERGCADGTARHELLLQAVKH